MHKPCESQFAQVWDLSLSPEVLSSSEFCFSCPEGDTEIPPLGPPHPAQETLAESVKLNIHTSRSIS